MLQLSYYLVGQGAECFLDALPRHRTRLVELHSVLLRSLAPHLARDYFLTLQVALVAQQYLLDAGLRVYVNLLHPGRHIGETLLTRAVIR